MEYAMQCGCRLIASVHGMDMDEALRKPALGDLIRKRVFERYVVLGCDEHPGRIREIYDGRGDRYGTGDRRDLILTATCGAGYVYCKELNDYIAKLRYLRYTVSLIRERSTTPMRPFRRPCPK